MALTASPLDPIPIHTNKALAMKRPTKKETTARSQKAIDSGDVQAVIDSLSVKQRRFCDEYIIDLKVGEAANRAGYNCGERNASTVGTQLLKNKAVRITIDALLAERSKHSAITSDYVLRGIKKTIERAEAGNNFNAILRGYELLAKHLGMFIERTEISGPDGEAIRTEQKIKEDVADFTTAIARLSRRSSSS